MNEVYRVWFFAGGETTDNRFNTFTGSFIKLMRKIFKDHFEYIRGVYFSNSMFNVLWALSNAQKPILSPESSKITRTALNQIIDREHCSDEQLIIISSSYGSVVAAQTACSLAEQNRNFAYFKKPFHLVLGASMVASGSGLYRQLLKYQREGYIGTIIHDEIQDEGDNSVGIGGKSRLEAYINAFGIMFPFLSFRFKGPSFLNTNPEKGHIHRKRSMTVQKAIDFITIILIKYQLAGNMYMEKAEKAISETVGKEMKKDRNIGYAELHQDRSSMHQLP